MRNCKYPCGLESSAGECKACHQRLSIAWKFGVVQLIKDGLNPTICGKLADLRQEMSYKGFEPHDIQSLTNEVKKCGDRMA